MRLTLELAVWLALYTWLVVYDLRAWVVFPSAWRYLRFPVDPSIVSVVPGPLPDHPADLERLVKRLVPWASDADLYGLPWYFPTPREALRAGRGDCEAESVVLASLLAARGIPYTFRASFSHLWVDYPGRPEEPGESRSEALMQNVGGHYRFHWPELPELLYHLRVQRDLWWTPLAPLRKVLLLFGWPAIVVAVPRRRRKRDSHDVGSPA